jgi:hypothetical protein
MSERYREITNGTITIPLIAKSGLVPVSGQVASRDPNIVRPDSETSIIAEAYTLNMVGLSTKDLAVKCQQLIKLLRQAMNYKKTSWQKIPVYIKEKLHCEDIPRFALCLGPAGMNYSDLFEDVTEFQNVIVNIGIVLIREHPWRDAIPGHITTVMTLTGVDGPATTTKCPVANFRDAFDITHIYNYDTSIATFSANLAGTASHYIWKVGAGTPAAGDIYYIGSTTGPIKNIIIPIATAGSYTCDMVAEYGKGGGAPVWTALTDGTNYTRFPTGVDDDLFKIANTEYSLNVLPPSDYAVCTINGVSAWWIRVRINAWTAWVTTPVTQVQPEYASSNTHIDIPATAIKGDANALSLFRLFSPTGGGTTPSMGTISRIIAGIKSFNLASFAANLNLGNVAIPAGWATTYGTDSAAAADVQAPGNSRGHTTFATNATLLARVTLTGTAMVDIYKGRYKAYVRAQQVGGAAGDCRVQLRTMIGGVAAGYPLIDNETIALQNHDLGWELIDLTPNSFINIPFAETEAVDILTTDLIFILRAERLAGASVLRFADLILIPIDEWFFELRDPISDVTSGGSALRGDTTMDEDGGVISDRALKYLGPGTAGNLFPSEYWNRSGENLQLRPLTRHKIFFLLAHYPTTFGTGPLIGSLGMQLFMSIYPSNRYNMIGDT